jgi:peroxiredoxin
MKRVALLIILTVLAASGCKSTRSDGQKQPGPPATGKIPQFVAVDSEGKEIRSSQFTQKPVVIAFFDRESILAWRTLTRLNEAWGGSNSLIVLAVTGSKEGSAPNDDINTLKRQYEINFPIVVDADNKLLTAFQIEKCCDQLKTYDVQGDLGTSTKLNESYDRVAALVQSLNSGSADAAKTDAANDLDLYSGLKISTADGVSQSISVAAGPPIIVNLFDEFCTECATGNRLESLKRLESSPKGAGHVVVIFSQKKFSADDMDNFRKLLPAPFRLESGNIDAASGLLINGRFLMVFDANKHLVWQERPNLSEQEIVIEISKLLN